MGHVFSLHSLKTHELHPMGFFRSLTGDLGSCVFFISDVEFM